MLSCNATPGMLHLTKFFTDSKGLDQVKEKSVEGYEMERNQLLAKDMPETWLAGCRLAEQSEVLPF